MSGISLWLLFFFSLSLSFFLFYSFFTLDKIKEDMLKYPASLEKKSTGKISCVSAGLLDYGSGSPVSLSHLMAGVFVPFSSPRQLSVLDFQAVLWATCVAKSVLVTGI